MSNLPKVVLAISQDLPSPQAVGGPDTDFAMLARAMQAELIGRLGHTRSALMKRFEDFSALDISQALVAMRSFPDADVYVSFSERVGIPLGAMLARRRRRPAHVMIAHRLNTRAKAAASRLTRWPKGVDKIITVCSTQDQFAEAYTPGRCRFLFLGLDRDFFRPASDTVEEDYALSVGNESRDYKTLVAAAQIGGFKVKIRASSPWSRSASAGKESVSSGLVEFLPRLDPPQLIDLYRRASAVVVPLLNVDYAAGLNGVLEGLCMHKPVIVTDSRGIVDYVRHKSSAYLVPAGDPEAMAEAMGIINQNAALNRLLRVGAGRFVEENANLDSYVRKSPG